ncbi:MAG: YggS family pyridoxal phosphate-dependent enzyme [Clostridia bacterium]|nr:YggS family pyridoxal phosphate-dependent enzyme [Clostridia bacterium]
MVEERVLSLLKEIEKGNNYGEKINVVAATKTVPVETINKAIKLGISAVAENRVQEFLLKTSDIVGAEQQFIGHLQTNKVKYLVGKVSLIQSVDSINLAEEINKRALKLNVVQNILIEINVGGELSKSGFSVDNVKQEILPIFNLKGIKVKGLMAMLPKSEDQNYLASLCKKMRSIYDYFNEQGKNFEYLSVGMSKDYKIAIQNGSNTIRPGSALFGERV